MFHVRLDAYIFPRPDVVVGGREGLAGVLNDEYAVVVAICWPKTVGLGPGTQFAR